MSLRSTAIRCLMAAVVSWLALVAPATGDWLVTRDGARVETRGPWAVKGRQVVFTRPNGTLSALRLDEIDLEASRRATEEAEREEPPPPPEAREAPPVMVLTNEDLPPRSRRPSASPEAEGEAEASAAETETPENAEPSPATESSVEVTSWKADPSDETSGLELTGVLRNTGVDIAANVTVAVTILDEDGETLLETGAFLRSSGIAPGRTTTFKALLPGIVQLRVDPVFAVRALAVTAASAPAGGEESEEEDAADGQAGDVPPSMPDVPPSMPDVL